MTCRAARRTALSTAKCVNMVAVEGAAGAGLAHSPSNLQTSYVGRLHFPGYQHGGVQHTVTGTDLLQVQQASRVHEGVAIPAKAVDSPASTLLWINSHRLTPQAAVHQHHDCIQSQNCWHSKSQPAQSKHPTCGCHLSTEESQYMYSFGGDSRVAAIQEARGRRRRLSNQKDKRVVGGALLHVLHLLKRSGYNEQH